jgi:myo-inositol-hexaphosphate 3-phosphohydrolase
MNPGVQDVKPGPRLVKFESRQSKSDVQQVIDDVRGQAEEIDDIVIVYRRKGGGLQTISNQGNTAGTFYFLEQAKVIFMSNSRRSVPPVCPEENESSHRV